MVVNVVVYINVDGVEGDCEVVFVLNVDVFGKLVVLCVEWCVLLVYILIDYVFDGCGEIVWCEIDLIGLINVYGVFKFVGEVVVCVVIV